jgi:hypothetical protein
MGHRFLVSVQFLAMSCLLLSPTRATAQTSVSGWLDVTAPAYGAIPDDANDDTAAIQSAANAMNGTPNASVLYFPPGTYRVNGTITLGNTGIVAGAGMDRSIVLSTSTSATVFSTAGTAGRIIFRDFKIDSSVTKTGGAGILLTTPGTGNPAQQDARIENMWIQAQYRGVVVTNATYWTIRDTVVRASVADGILINVTSNPDAGDNLVTGCVIQSGTTDSNGIHIQSSGGQKIIGNKILGHGVGIRVQPVSIVRLTDILISNNSIEDQSAYGIFWQTPTTNTGIVNSHIVGNQFNGQGNLLDPPGGGVAILLSGNIQGVVVNSNQISVNGSTSAAPRYGIVLTSDGVNAPHMLTMTGNNITGDLSAGSVGIYGGTVMSVGIHGNYVAGVATPFSQIAGRITDATFTAATLPAFAGNGSLVYCQDCVVAATCSGSGSGAFAKRLNGAWVCQ